MFIILAQFYSSTPTPEYDEIASALRRRGHEIWVATPGEAGELVVRNGTNIIAKLKKPAIPAGKFFALPGIKSLVRWSVEWAFAIRLRRFIRKNSPDVIHLNPPMLTFFWLIPLLVRDSTRYILDWRQINERVHKGLLGKIKDYIALQYRRIPSRYIYDQACFLHPAGAKQVLGEQWQRWATVVPLAISASFLTDVNNAPDPPENEATVRFVYIGTLNRVRRLERIILAAQEVQLAANGRNDFELTFIGPDNSDGRYQEIINQLDLNPIVSINPPVLYLDVPEVLTRYDVALAIVPEHPLDWQFHPTLKILEYRALGMPIIATDFDINRETVQDEVNGLLVSNTSENIAQAMQRFVQESGFLRQCKLNALSMRQGLLWRDIGEMYEQLYQRLLRQRE